jgi:threonine dehydrogenase-like Zn-dependent dehydrogenase
VPARPGRLLPDGGLATHAIVPETQAYILPDSMPATHGALCEPLACSLHGLDRAGILPGMSVAVIGGGVIGQLMVQLARLAGATTVVLSTLFASGRSLAERLGATATVDPRAQDPVAAVAAPGGLVPGGVDVVLECVGSVETFQQALGMAARGGTILVFGVAAQHQQTAISPYDIFARELRIAGSYLNPLTHGRAVELAASGTLDLDALITRRLSLEEVAAVIMAPPAADDVKAMMIA